MSTRRPGAASRCAPLILRAAALLTGWWYFAFSLSATEWRRQSFLLRPGVPVERRIADGEVHVYRLELAPGPWIVTVTQMGVDVVLAVEQPEDSRLGPFNSPFGKLGAESVVVQLDKPGSVGVEVRPSAATEGTYGLEVDALSQDTPEARRRLLAEAAMTEAARRYAEGSADARRPARELYREALAHWQAAGDPHGEARALTALAALSHGLGEPREARDLYRRALSEWRASGDRQGEAFTVNGLGLVHDRLGESGTALELFEEAVGLWRRLGEPGGEASARNNLCLALQRQGEFPAARTCYGEALELFRRLGDRGNEATVLSNLGGVHWNLGEPEPALELYREALEERRALGDGPGEAVVWNNLGLLYVGLGEAEEALIAFGRALELFRDAESRFGEALALGNLGYAYLGLGELERSLAFLERALPLRRAAGDRRGEAATLRNLGRVWQRLGEPKKARDACREALELSRGLGDRRGEATVLNLLGTAHAALGDLSLALSAFHRSIEIQRALGDRRQEAEALLELGVVRREAGDPELALASLRRAEELYRAVRDPAGEMRALAAAGRAERDRGRPDRAWADAGAALTLLESVRTRAGEPLQRAAFLGSQRGVYELYVDLLMERHGADPAAGHDLEALEASERARSRALLELVTGPRPLGERSAGPVDPALGTRLRAAERRLTGATRRLYEVLGREHGEADTAHAERALYEALTGLETVRAEMRRRSPRYASLTGPRPVRAAAIRALLEPETLLLEYLLGDERSFLWAVDRDSVESFELPGRAEIEALARQTHRELTALDLRTGKTSREAASRLASRILGPVAARIAEFRRLAVVADGALHYLPFAALPSPSASDGRPLLADHEVVHLPSASVLAAARRLEGPSRGESSVAPPKVLAVLADPVFDASDPRVRSRSPASPQADENASAATRAAEGLGLAGLGRLGSSGREAAAIAALVPPGERLLAVGFEAARSRVVGGELEAYRIVHFATHGLLNPRAPEISGLVLTQLDADGKAQDGFLSLHDIYGLELRAELVVLSGCRTALGKEIHGEGLVGLTRGFMYAGVPRVVASLWQVQDEATAELMTRFYRAMLSERQRPAGALRAAQLSIRSERRWSDPFYWGAFVLQGEWR